MTDLIEIFVTFPPRRFPIIHRRVLGLGLVALFLLGACTPTVQKAGPQEQAAPQLTAPSEQPDEQVSPDADSMGTFLEETAVTRIEIDGAVKVGLLLPLSGRHAAIGEALLNAAQFALFDIAGDRFTLVVRDTGGTPEGAQLAARSALDEGARLILGPLFSSSIASIADEVRGSGVNVIGFSNDRSVATDGVFVMGLTPYPQIHRMISYAVDQGLNRFAVLAPQTPYGNAVVEALQDAVQRNGAQLSRVVSYNPESADLSAEVRLLADYATRRQALLAQRQVLVGRQDEAAKMALKRLDGLETLGPLDFQAVILPEGGKRLQVIAPTLAYFDIDPAEIRYLGTSLWEDPHISTEPALLGGWFTAPPPDLWASFQARYKETYGNEPPRLSSLAYDAIALAAVLTRQAIETGREPAFTIETLTQPSGFAGVDGAFRFLPTGEVERSYAVMQIRRGGFEVLDAAPRSFQRLVN